MQKLFTEARNAPVEGSKVLVLGAEPEGALDIAERLEGPGAEAITAFNFQHLCSALRRGVPDAAVVEFSYPSRWISVSVALLHELGVPLVMGVIDSQRSRLRPKLPHAIMLESPMDPNLAVGSLGIILNSNWPRLLQPKWMRPHEATGDVAAVERTLTVLHGRGDRKMRNSA